MKCRFCGAEFISLFSDICPFCGCDNSESILDHLLSPAAAPKSRPKEDKDENDMEDPDNFSDEEYMEDDDFDDFDN